MDRWSLIGPVLPFAVLSRRETERAEPHPGGRQRADPGGLRCAATALRCSAARPCRPTRFAHCVRAAQTVGDKSDHVARWRARAARPVLLGALHARRRPPGYGPAGSTKLGGRPKPSTSAVLGKDLLTTHQCDLFRHPSQMASGLWPRQRDKSYSGPLLWLLSSGPAEESDRRPGATGGLSRKPPEQQPTSAPGRQQLVAHRCWSAIGLPSS